jgi:RNA polymerase sigma factor (sigma-70 family)
LTQSIDFGAVYKRYSRDVLHFALYLSGNRTDAEEIAGETFVRAWLATGEIRAETLKAYLLTIARNLYIERSRRRRRQGGLAPGIAKGLSDSAAGPEQTASGRDELAAVMRALHTMPEIDRAAVLMRANEVPYDGIARALDISPAAARVKVHRARMKLASQGLGGS